MLANVVRLVPSIVPQALHIRIDNWKKKGFPKPTLYPKLRQFLELLSHYRGLKEFKKSLIHYMICIL